MKIAACLFVRDEEADIAEWAIYHLHIGFDTLIVYDNGSADKTVLILDRLRRLYDIKVIDWPRQSKYAQLEAYDDCIKNFAFDFFRIAFLDSDEFICMPGGLPFRNILYDLAHADAVVLNWAIYGSSGHAKRPEGLLIESFLSRAPRNFAVNHHTKMIVRPDRVISVDNPHSFSVEGAIVHADGSPFARGNGLGTSADLAGFDVCRVNHYFVRSQDQWKAKMQRGYREGKREADQFYLHDRNEVRDESMVSTATSIKYMLKCIERLPIRHRLPISRTAENEMEKTSAEWAAVPNVTGDVLFSYADDSGLFDQDWYLSTYDDVRRAGVDPRQHYESHGRNEGRRPCSRKRLLTAFGLGD